MTSEKGITSEKKNKFTDPNDVSVMPLPPQAEITRHENYVKYVKVMVQNWLNLQGEEYYKKNPKYERSALTNFLFMTLLASFLEVANASGMAAFKYMHGHKEGYYEFKGWQKMEALTMKKWIAHNRSGWIWNYMSTSLGVRNFTPEDPADIENWKNWLTQDQVIQLMTWLFDECWRDNPDRWNHYETKMQLWDHHDAHWDMFRHLEKVQWVTESMTYPFPSCWTWSGFMKREKLKCVEKATNLFWHKIGDAESMAKLHTDSFATKISVETGTFVTDPWRCD